MQDGCSICKLLTRNLLSHTALLTPKAFIVNEAVNVATRYLATFAPRADGTAAVQQDHFASNGSKGTVEENVWSVSLGACKGLGLSRPVSSRFGKTASASPMEAPSP